MTNKQYIKYKKKYLNLKYGNFVKGINLPKYVFYNSFPKIKNIDRNELLLPKNDKYTNNGIKESNFISDVIEGHAGSNIDILMDSGNYGIYPINMVLRFKNVYVVENDNVKFDILDKNIKLYKLDLRIKLFKNRDIVNILKEDVYDVVYLNESNIDKIFNLYENIKGETKFIVIKIPKKFKFNKLFSKLKIIKYFIYTFIYDNDIQFYILVIDLENK